MPPFAVAFLQDLGRGKLRVEESMLQLEFERRGIAVELYTSKNIVRRNLALSADTFIAGDMDAMHGAMKQLQIDIPTPNDYPKCLTPFLHRRIWKSSLGEVERHFLAEAGPPVFVKPSARRKNFTGQVLESPGDFMTIAAASKRQEVWCSEVVTWASEFRIYVVDDVIVGIDLYAGNEDAVLDMQVVEQALLAYRQSGEAPSAYGIDFGVLDSGETALVEANDGYALGAYTLQAKPYTDLLVRRWLELLHSRKL